MIQAIERSVLPLVELVSSPMNTFQNPEKMDENLFPDPQLEFMHKVHQEYRK